MEMLAAPRDDGQFCTADGAWCVTHDSVLISVTRLVDGVLQPVGEIAFPEGAGHSLWPTIVRPASGESVLIGVAQIEDQMYSGGGASVTHVTLHAVSASTSHSTAVLTWPSSGSVSTRACFSEADVAARREACTDQYEFSGALSLEAANAEGPARLVLSTDATTFPGRRSRSSDSTTEAPLQESDLRTVRDETCSYRRVATYDAAAMRYAWDQPLPPCADYLEP
jgi:hypothetical protein